MTANSNTPLGDTPAPFKDSRVPNGTPRFATLDGERGPKSASPGRVWLHRFGVLLFVFFCASLGVILVVFPWRDEWMSNALLIANPGLKDFMSNGFVRGLCSGLGLLDIWIGFWEAVHYHE